MNVPADLLYSTDHEWVRELGGGRIRIGITDYAQDQLGDIVFFELPKVGDSLTHLDKMGEVESVKAVSDLFSPIDGVVTEINEKLLDHPELVNADPFGEGWLIKATISDTAQLDGLMTAAEYDAFTAAP